MENENQNPVPDLTPKQDQGKAESKEEPKETVKEIHHHHYEYKRPRHYFGRFFWGLLFIFFGILFLAQASGLVQNVDIGSLFGKIWPVIVIFIGLSILSRGSVLGAIIGIIITILTLAFLAYVFFSPNSPWLVRENAPQTQEFNIAKESGATAASVHIKSGAGSILVSSRPGENAVSGTLHSNFATLQTNSSLNGTTQDVNITSQGNFPTLAGSNTNNLEVNLNETLPTILSVDSGASSMNIDLSNTTVDKFLLNTGASQLNLTIGDKVQNSSYEIKAGASSLNVTLPKTLGAKLTVESGLSSKDFIDFKQTGDNTYVSSNYDTVQNKVEISFKVGVSSINVNWK